MRRSDRRLEIFGAPTHRYEGIPMKLGTLGQLQEKCGVILPEVYLHHLATVGFGVGPDHGLYSPDDVLDFIEREFAPQLPFAFSPEDFPPSTNGGERPPIEWDGALAGCIPIANEGCTFHSAMVVAGEFTGTIWSFGEGCLELAKRPPGYVRHHLEKVPLPPLPQPPTFTEWDVGWMEQVVADLKQD